MRISDKEAADIKEVLHIVFGDKAGVILFGSRIDDSKKGGDIDLFVMPNSDEDKETLFRKKIAFISKLQARLDDASIDVVISEDNGRDIELEALQTGIRL